MQHAVADIGGGGELGVFDGVRPNRLIEAEARDHAVRSLRIELDVVDVDVGLGVGQLRIAVLLLGHQRVEQTVADVGAQRQRLDRLLSTVGANSW